MSNPNPERDERVHERHPSVRELTLCRELVTDVRVGEPVTCERCRDESIERGVAAYFRRHGLDRRFDLRGLEP